MMIFSYPSTTESFRALYRADLRLRHMIVAAAT